jgi:hypothetical protein
VPKDLVPPSFISRDNILELLHERGSSIDKDDLEDIEDFNKHKNEF